jgi:hypothetical protein
LVSPLDVVRREGHCHPFWMTHRLFIHGINQV